MPEREDKTIEELRRDRLKADIRRLESEASKLGKEREEIEKRISKKWYISDLGLKIMGLITAIVLIGSAIVSIIIPLTQSSIQLAENKRKSAEMKLDSAYVVLVKAMEIQKELTKQKQMLKARLDSIRIRGESRLDSISTLWKKERDGRKVDKRRLLEYESQIKEVKSQIRDTERDKRKIEEIFPFQVLSGRVMSRQDGNTLSLEGVLVMVEDGSIKCVTDENGAFKLEIPEGRGRLRLIFRKQGYAEKSLNIKPPNQSIEMTLEKH